MEKLHTAAATLAVVIGTLLATPTQLSAEGVGNTTACMSGSVDALDDASYDEDFGQWHNLSGVNLSSESLRVVLSVFDEYGNSICQNTADLTTSCKFQTGFASTFTIRVDNTQNSSPANYSVCAF
jgi:hypothetical protein